MLKRYTLTLLALLALPLLALLGLLPLQLVRSQLDPSTFILALCVWGSLAIALLLVLFALLIRKIWFFPGTGEPVSAEVLRARLLAVNELPCPVAAMGKRKKVIVTWRYTETQWCELFSRLGLNRLYELHCRLEADTRTVVLVDRIRVADFLICPQGVKIGRPRVPLPLLRARTRRLAAIDRYAGYEPHDYQFHAREIKSPVMGTILASGWNVRFSLF